MNAYHLLEEDCTLYSYVVVPSSLSVKSVVVFKCNDNRGKVDEIFLLDVSATDIT
jgi:hypothetical protein